MRITSVLPNKHLILVAVLSLPLTCAPPARTEDSAPKGLPSLTPLNSILNTAIEISAGANDIVIKGKHGLRIKVTNRSDRPVLFDGEKASASTRTVQYKCVDIDTFDELNMIPPLFRSTLSADAGSALSPSLLSSRQNDDLLKLKNTMLTKRGKDDLRKESDQERFGQRILWPGDSSEGIILFPAEESLVGAVVTVPIYSFFDSKDQATVSTTSPK